MNTLIRLLIMKWVIEYDNNWLPICEICWKSFKKLITHVIQKHNMTWVEYKKMFWLDLWIWIMCEESKKLAKDNILQNWQQCVVDNLSKWEPLRFKPYHRSKSYFSEQSRLRIQKQMIDYFINKK